MNRSRNSEGETRRRILYQNRKGDVGLPANHARIIRRPDFGIKWFEWPKGGGLVHHDARVDRDAFIGVGAQVGATARIGKHVEVCDNVSVDGRVMGRTVLTDNVYIEGGANISSGHVRLSDNVIVSEGTRLEGTLIAKDYVQFSGVDLTCFGAEFANDVVVGLGKFPDPTAIGKVIISTERQLAAYSEFLSMQYPEALHVR